MSTYDLYSIVKRPLVTEKNTKLMAEQNQYAFEVSSQAGRPQIKKAIEKLFKVKVEKVRTIQVRGKTKTFRWKTFKMSNWKKAYVTLKAGEKIELFQGV
ncbi:MAG: 50S ribosomal protein L23 [Deltaproteobacteria bacterium]|nr:50S ribosomal protein L23 [Deltaproteobacteria bacterium]